MEKTKGEAISVEMILIRLRGHLNEQKPVTLYNTYKGVPISYEADVAMIHPDNTIGLIVHPYQAVCIKHERRTYIESKSLPGLIRAYPVSIDYTNQVAVLRKLEFPKSISTDLHHSWVSPEKEIKIEISSAAHGEQLGKLSDIAVLEDNDIRIGIVVKEDIPVERGDAVSLAFRLKGEGDLIQMHGMIHSLKKIRNKKQRRMEVGGSAVMGDEISILAYVAKREDQIMKSLDKTYKNLRKGKSRKRK